MALGNLMQRVGIKIDADSSLAVTALDKTSLAMRRTVAETKKAGTATGSMMRLNKAAQSLVSTYTAVVAGAVAIGAATLKVVRVFAESEAVNKRLERAVSNTGMSWEQNTDSVNRLIAAQSRLVAVDDDLIKGSLATLVQMTGDLTEAQNLNAIALDMSRATGKDLNTTALLLGKVYNGNVSILKRYGIVVKDGATSTEALGEIQKKYSGYAADYGEGTSASLDRITIAYENAQESAGRFATEVMLMDERLNFASARLEEMSAGKWANVVKLNIPIYGAFYQKQLRIADAAAMTTDALDKQSRSVDGLASGVDNAGLAYKRYTAAVEESSEALAAEQDAELKMLRSKQEVKEKRKELTQAVKEHGKKSREARIATLELKIAEREAAAASSDFKTKQEDLNNANKRLASEGSETIEFLRHQRDLMGQAAGKAGTLGRRIGAIRTEVSGGTKRGYAQGGRAVGPSSGYAATLHGNEWVIPERRDTNSLRLLAQAAEAIGAKSSSGITVNVNGDTLNPSLIEMLARRGVRTALVGSGSYL